MADRRYDAHAGDDDAVHAIHVLLATSFSIARHDVADGLEFLHPVSLALIGNLDVELLFQVEDHLDGVERLDAQILQPVGQLDLGLIACAMLGDDRDHVCRYVAHPDSALSRSVASAPARRPWFAAFRPDRAAPFGAARYEDHFHACAHAAAPDSRTRMSRRATLVPTPEPAATCASAPIVTWSAMPDAAADHARRSPMVTLPDIPTMPQIMQPFADRHVVTDMHVVVDLGAVADPRRFQRRAVDRGAGADLDVVADHDTCRANGHAAAEHRPDRTRPSRERS